MRIVSLPVFYPRANPIARSTPPQFRGLVQILRRVFVTMRTVRLGLLNRSAGERSRHRTATPIDVVFSSHYLKMIGIHAASMHASWTSRAFLARVMAHMPYLQSFRYLPFVEPKGKDVPQGKEGLQILLNSEPSVSAFGQLASPKPASSIRTWRYIVEESFKQCVSLDDSHTVSLKDRSVRLVAALIRCTGRFYFTSNHILEAA